MKARFTVTYEVITPESAADGDAAERGFVASDGAPVDDRALMTLREALAIAGSFPEDAGACRWFSSYPETDYTTGAETIYSLHVPATITASSARRVARVVGALR